jgi:RNA polymerase sigma factor (sigma-70 family)
MGLRSSAAPVFGFARPAGRRYNARMTSDASNQARAPEAARFATTSWTMILAARDAEPGQAPDALATLCATYWYPLYAFIRRRGHSPEEAEDLTQEFFARLLEKDFLADVDRAKGKFRSFLLAACSHLLANQRDHDQAWKRGGRCRTVSIDFGSAEARYGKEPFHDLTAEKLFARRWGLTLLDRALASLSQEYAAKNKSILFERMRVCLLGNPDAVPYAQLAQELGLTATALRVAVHRLRQRFQEVLRDEIAKTVEDPRDIDDEIRDLFAAVGPEKQKPL